MAHYAKLDDNNIVIDIIVIANEDCLDENGNECEEPGRCLCEALTGYAKWKKTSCNTRMGVHYDPNTGEPSEDQSKAYRLNYAAGKKYDEILDAFVEIEPSPKLAQSSRKAINPNTGFWSLPKPEISVPNDAQLDVYPLDEYLEPWFWDEKESHWVKLKIGEGEVKDWHFLIEEMH
jgi:hypothetical protein